MERLATCIKSGPCLALAWLVRRGGGSLGPQGEAPHIQDMFVFCIVVSDWQQSACCVWTTLAGLERGLAKHVARPTRTHCSYFIESNFNKKRQPPLGLFAHVLCSLRTFRERVHHSIVSHTRTLSLPISSHSLAHIHSH